MVAWDTVSRPIKFWGLGVKDLRLQGLALRVRWEWLRRTDPSRPWHGLPALRDAEALSVFQSFVQISVGNGENVMFWTDNWIHGCSASDIAPHVVAAVSSRRKNTQTVAQGMIVNSWTLDIFEELTEEGLEEYTRMCFEVNTVDRDEQQPDTFRWKCTSSGVYSAKETYDALCHGK